MLSLPLRNMVAGEYLSAALIVQASWRDLAVVPRSALNRLLCLTVVLG
jgi:hypothetical protein